MSQAKFQAELSRRLDAIELTFIGGNFTQAFDDVEGLLRDLITVDGIGSVRGLHVDQHKCHSGCVCLAAVAIGVQCLYELRRSAAVDPFLEMYYQRLSTLPCQLLVLWTQLKFALGQHLQACQCIKERLEYDKSERERQATATTSLVPTPFRVSTSLLTLQQYTELVEFLVLGMAALGEHDPALRFVERNRLIPALKQRDLLVMLQQSKAARALEAASAIPLSDDSTTPGNPASATDLDSLTSPTGAAQAVPIPSVRAEHSTVSHLLQLLRDPAAFLHKIVALCRKFIAFIMDPRTLTDASRQHPRRMAVAAVVLLCALSLGRTGSWALLVWLVKLAGDILSHVPLLSPAAVKSLRLGRDLMALFASTNVGRILGFRS